VQCKIDDVAATLGLYKIKMMSHHGPCCMFASTPEMPPKQQAGVMFAAAKRLSSMLAEVSSLRASCSVLDSTVQHSSSRFTHKELIATAMALSCRIVSSGWERDCG
jgi:hypothetical protein